MNLRARLGHVRTAVVCRGELLPATANPNPPARLRTPADILNLLEQMTATVQSDPFTSTANKARAVGHLAAVALKAIEANNLTARVELLEAVLKKRPAGGTS
jgi:hypothetical protein